MVAVGTVFRLSILKVAPQLFQRAVVQMKLLQQTLIRPKHLRVAAGRRWSFPAVDSVIRVSVRMASSFFCGGLAAPYCSLSEPSLLSVLHRFLADPRGWAHR